MRLKFQKTECSRCGGSGRYSFNLVHGDMCYGCQGSGKQLTRAGKKARAIYDEMSKKSVSEVQVGDVVRVPGLSRDKWQKVQGIETNSQATTVIVSYEKSEYHATILVFQGPSYYHVAPGAKVTVKPPFEIVYDALKDHPGIIVEE